jgi:hypothetical protein
MWLPTVTNVPALLALRANPRGGVPSPVSNLVTPSVVPPRAAAAPAVVGVAPARRDAAPPSSQPKPKILGSLGSLHRVAVCVAEA